MTDEKYELPEDLYEILFDQHPSMLSLLEHQMNTFHGGRNACFSARQVLDLLTKLRESGLLWRPWFMKKFREIQQENGKEGLVEQYVKEMEEEIKALRQRLGIQETRDDEARP